MNELADKVIRVCREIALCTEDPGRITRTFLSPPMHDVHSILGDWMRESGMQVSVDAAGNLRAARGNPDAPHLMIGSHLDTVPNAGPFDGVLGVVMGAALAEALPFVPLEVTGFSEEEGVRFGIPFIGSRALCGTLGRATLDRCDRDGVSIREAIRNFGLDPARLPEARISPRVSAYLEFHIEQGPVLDHADLPLGVVNAIVGQSRLTVTFTGEANHAGTTPMKLRHDALAAAAEWIGAVETFATTVEDLVATTGSIHVSPNAGNVVPGQARVSLDVRHASDGYRHQAVRSLLDQAAAISAKRDISVRHEALLDQPAVAMNAALAERLVQAVKQSGYPAHRMNSGAGHDAMILAQCIPTAMLFLRSPRGLSHHPDETVLTADVAAALEVGWRFINDMEEADV